MGVNSYASEVTLFEYNVSTILSPIVGSGASAKTRYQGFPLVNYMAFHQLLP